MNYSKKVNRIIFLIGKTQQIKKYYNELDQLVFSLSKNKEKVFSSGKNKISITDNFENKNTSFRVTAMRRFEATILNKDGKKK